MRDRRLKVHATRGDQVNRVFQMAARADIGEKISQTSFAQGIDVELERLPEPRHADDLAPRANRLDRLDHRLVPGQALLRASAGTLEDHVGPIASSQVAYGGYRVDLRGIQRMIGPQ